MSFGDSRSLEDTILSARHAAQALSDENQARLAQLMTVWASGYLEATCRDVLRAYAERRADPSVARFVSHQLDRFSNPKMEKIVDLVRSFDKNRANELDEFAEGAIKESVNSIVGLRNQIAHGRQTDISVGRIGSHFDHAREFARKLEALFNTPEKS